MRNIYKINILIILIAFSFVASPFVNNIKAGFGISPSDIVNDRLKPGSRIEKKFVISRVDVNEELLINVEPDLESMESWFSFKPGNSFEFPQGQQRAEFVAIIDVPQDAELKEFNGNIRITASPKELPVGGINIVKGARVEVQLVTTGVDVTELLVRDLDIKDIEEGNNVVLSIKVENVGNTDTAPSRAVLKVSDLVKNPIASFETTEMNKIPAGETQDIDAAFETNLEPGEYFGNVKLYLGDSLLREEDIYFRISEKPEQDELTTAPVDTEQVDTGYQPFMSLLSSKVLLGLSVVLFTFIIILFIARRKKHSGIISAVLFFLSTVLVLTVFTLLMLYYLFSKGIEVSNLTSNTGIIYAPIVVGEEEVVTKQESISLVEPTETKQESEEIATAEVQGLSTVASEEDFVEYGVKVVDRSTLRVVGPQSLGDYFVYQAPSVESTVLYTAAADEVLTVTDEQPGWFKVALPNGDVGWIEEASVKKVE